MKKYFCSALILLISFTAYAQQPAPTMTMCEGQIALYCSAERETKDLREILKCLVKNDDKLSTECKQEIQRYAQASRQTAPPGGGPLGALGGLTGAGSQVPSASYAGFYIAAPGDNSATPAMTENNLNISMPLFKGETDTVSATVTAGNLYLNKPITLDSNIVVPNDLYRFDAGLQYTRQLPEKRSFGIRGSVGYTGDKVDKKTESFNVSANYSFPGSKEGHWILMVFISNNSPLGTYVPVPGFFYIYRTQTFTGLFGIPILSMQWTPVNPWSFSFSAFGPTVKTEAAYGAIDQTQFFTGLGWKQQRYMLSSRLNEDDRLTFEEKNAEIGFRRPLSQSLYSEFQTGYVFDRSVYMGEGLFNKDSGEAKLDSSWYVKWSLRLAF